MPFARCPLCDDIITIGADLGINHPVTCPTCLSNLKIVSIEPYELEEAERRARPGSVDRRSDNTYRQEPNRSYDPVRRSVPAHHGDRRSEGSRTEGSRPNDPNRRSDDNRQKSGRPYDPNRRPEENRSEGSRPYDPNRRPEGSRPEGSQPYDPNRRPEGNRLDSNRPYDPNRRSEGSRPEGGRPYNPNRRPDGNRSDSNRPYDPNRRPDGNRSDSNRPYDPNRSQSGTRPDGYRPGSSDRRPDGSRQSNENRDTPAHGGYNDRRSPGGRLTFFDRRPQSPLTPEDLGKQISKRPQRWEKPKEDDDDEKWLEHDEYDEFEDKLNRRTGKGRKGK